MNINTQALIHRAAKARTVEQLRALLREATQAKLNASGNDSAELGELISTLNKAIGQMTLGKMRTK